MKDFIKINENDNVIVAIKELAEGEKVTVDGKEYTAAETCLLYTSPSPRDRG